MYDQWLCHQGFQSPKVIEEMLRDSDKRQCYLTWQSEIRDKRFILSYVTLKGAVKPNPSAHKCFVSLTETSDRIEKMIVSNDDCIYPVSVPVPYRNDTSDDNNNSLEDIGVVSDLSCYACGYLAEHWRELNKHTETHIEKRCQECERFIGTNSLFKIGGNWFCTPVCTSLLYCIDNFLEVLWI